MLKPQSIVFTLLAILLLSSCASILNSPTMKVNIGTSQPAMLIIEDDTIQSERVGKSIEVYRDGMPLNVEIIQNGTSENMNIYSHNSAAYYINFAGLPLYGVPTLIGLMADKNNPKRHAYPKTIYINTEDYSYKTSNINNQSPYKTIIKTSPFSPLNMINPNVEFALEMRKNNQWSTQFGGAYLIPKYIYGLSSVNKSSFTGYGIALEQKYYLAKTAPNGFYTSIEGRFMNREGNFTSKFYSSNSEPINHYRDTFYMVQQDASVRLKLGYQKIVHRLALDGFIGYGVTNTNIRHLNRKNSDDYLLDATSYGYLGKTDLNEGELISNKLFMGFKIGLAF